MRELLLLSWLILRFPITVILGDTSDSRSLLVAARGADVLVHEATVIEQEADLASPRGHSTACGLSF
jgi:ribonuclease BN (tRNA processing enzyme)